MFVESAFLFGLCIPKTREREDSSWYVFAEFTCTHCSAATNARGNNKKERL